MLESAVQQIPELANVKNIKNSLVAGGQPAPDYDKYCSMLMSAAVQHDDSMKLPTSCSKHVAQLVDAQYENEHEWFDHVYLDAGDNYYSGYPNDYMYSVHRVQQQSSSSQRFRLPTAMHNAEQHLSNNKKDGATIRVPREIRDKLSLDTQAEIKAWNQSTAMRYRPKSSLRKAHSHEFSAWMEMFTTLMRRMTIVRRTNHAMNKAGNMLIKMSLMRTQLSWRILRSSDHYQ